MSDKGKQYMAFDALEGFRAQIEKRNRIYIPKPQLSDDQKEAMNIKIASYIKGDIISLKYYNDGSISHITGELKCLDVIYKLITVDKAVISFENILEIY